LPNSLHRTKVRRPQKVLQSWSSAWLSAGKVGRGIHWKRQFTYTLVTSLNQIGCKKYSWWNITKLMQCYSRILYRTLWGRKLTYSRCTLHAWSWLDHPQTRRHNCSFFYFNRSVTKI
jgi:hypothetical protein